MAATSNDRRVVTIGAVTMVVFLLIGVGSAAVFARPSCRAVAPTVTPASERFATTIQTDTLTDPALVAFVAALEADATVTAFSGEGLTDLAQFGDGVAALGRTLFTFDALVEPSASVTFRNGTVVGSGAILYALAVANDVTNQIDALQPLDATLSAQTCVELALVSTPLAFFRDAADGEVMLLRADEDGDDPFVEVRDPFVGRRLELPVTLRIGSAGQHGARTSGVLTPDSIVFAQNVSDTADDATALWMFDRNTGAEIATLTGGQIRDVTNRDGELALRLTQLGNDPVLFVNDTVRFDVLQDGNTLTLEASPPAAVGQGMYAELAETFARDFVSLSHVTHQNGEMFLVDTGESQVLLRVTHARR